MPQQQQPPAVSGLIERVPCPSCGKANDFRVIHEQNLMDTGSDLECDHCRSLMQVVAIRQATIVAVRPSTARARASLPEPQPATTLGGRMLNKLIGRR